MPLGASRATIAFTVVTSICAPHTGASADPGEAGCVPILSNTKVLAYNCSGEWHEAEPPPSGGGDPEPWTSDDGDPEPWNDPGTEVDAPGEDTRNEASGDGNGAPPPSCVERRLRPSRGQNTIDDTGLAGVWYQRRCDDGTRGPVFRPNEDPGPGAEPAPPDPGDLAEELYGEMFVRLPSPTVHVAPADQLEHDWVYVQQPAFFWTDEWYDLTSSLTVGPVSVTLVVLPERIEVDLGNGDRIDCVDAPPFPAGGDPMTFDGCEYTYHHSSSVAPNGTSWPASVSMVWSVSWSSNVGAGGDFGEVSTTRDRDLRVAEVQAVIVDTHPDD